MNQLKTEEQQPGLKGMEERGGNFVPVGQVVALFEVSERQVQYWAKNIKTIRKNGRGQYDLLSVIQGVYTFQRAIIDNRGDDSLSRKRGEKIDKELHLMDLQIKQKDETFVDTEDLEKALSKVFVEFKNIRLLPRSYSQQLVNKCQQLINTVAKRKKIKKFTLLVKEKKTFSADIEKLLMTQLDKALENLARGFTPERLTNGNSDRSNK